MLCVRAWKLVAGLGVVFWSWTVLGPVAVSASESSADWTVGIACVTGPLATGRISLIDGAGPAGLGGIGMEARAGGAAGPATSSEVTCGVGVSSLGPADSLAAIGAAATGVVAVPA